MDGKKLKSLRRSKGYTLDTLSDQTGISKSYLSLIERDIQSNPSLDILYKLAKTLGTEVEELIKSEREEQTIQYEQSSPSINSTIKIEIELPLEAITFQKLEQIQQLIEIIKELKLEE
ncbi:helix-turn-helix domain-containing protein [Mesobacillus maritimus]|uniref:helix-turn-helix domain-containing protein n=1 Tax=Mesobacillus maritimus TaxID=1643336 RepID=UPI002041B88B|nr:helix-turn-helix transcriptional regulator [Mesobacillus maritimus]MCM3585502.1 helix-turn-helix domain-containing protein [Mesobacillus maritimus]MCM3669762.1 helix-turn-helix domain-containing protein [Mesobacillus maritimus]